MTCSFRLLLFLIHIDQETILKWFGLSNPENELIFYNSNTSFSTLSDELSTDLSMATFRLIIAGLWHKLQSGLTLTEIENVLFLILFVRFVLLAIKYNLKTSFYITCITFATGYLWYRHLIDLMLLYRTILLKIPFFHKLGNDGLTLMLLRRQAFRNDVILGENVHWYNLGKLIYYTFTKGIVDVDPATNLKSYIDPISMIVANLEEPAKSIVIPYYYKVYNKIIPTIFSTVANYWTQLSGVASYAVITRIGKRYCPYSVRWHWTLMLILNFPEQILIYLTNRMIYFQSVVLIPQLFGGINEEVLNELLYEFGSVDELLDESILLQVNIINALLACIAIIHVSFVMFALLHAVCGQYFYVPFFVENAELHIGPRPKNSVYSGGYTSWQDPEEKEKRIKQIFPTFWYGWFGKRRNSNWKPIRFIINNLTNTIARKFKKFWKL